MDHQCPINSKHPINVRKTSTATASVQHFVSPAATGAERQSQIKRKGKKAFTLYTGNACLPRVKWIIDRQIDNGIFF